jgi:hypothetical protein
MRKKGEKSTSVRANPLLLPTKIMLSRFDVQSQTARYTGHVAMAARQRSERQRGGTPHSVPSHNAITLLDSRQPLPNWDLGKGCPQYGQNHLQTLGDQAELLGLRGFSALWT